MMRLDIAFTSVFFSSTFDFDSFDEIFLLLYYILLKFELIVLTNFSYLVKTEKLARI